MSDWKKFPKRQIEIDKENAKFERAGDLFILLLCLGFAALLLRWVWLDTRECGWDKNDPRSKRPECRQKWRSHEEADDTIDVRDGNGV